MCLYLNERMMNEKDFSNNAKYQSTSICQSKKIFINANHRLLLPALPPPNALPLSIVLIIYAWSSQRKFHETFILI